MFIQCKIFHCNNKLSSTSQSIDPGQQFTWEHSNLEVNKPKNRYANVIAYDHSRVLLSAIDGMPPTDIFPPNCCIDSTDSQYNCIFQTSGVQGHCTFKIYSSTSMSDYLFPVMPQVLAKKDGLRNRHFSLQMLRQAFKSD